MFGKTIKEVIAIFFIPVAIATTKAFFKGLEGFSYPSVNSSLLIGGFFSYPFFHIIFMRPVYVYVLGHEIVHVLATWLCAGKVTSFQISQGGGSVTTTKTNLFIRLSPYFVPIHLVFLFLLYWILSRFYDMSKFTNGFMFLIGFTLSFYLIMTVEVMKTRQPDMLKTGYLFSVIFIYVVNASFLILILSFVDKNVSFVSFANDVWLFSKGIYSYIFNSLFV